MTSAMAPYRSKQPVGRDGFAQLLRAEFTKFRTVRAWVITLGVAAALMVGSAWVTSPHTAVCIAGPKSPPSCSTPSLPRPPLGPNGEPVVDTFSFVHQMLIGNGSVTAKISKLTETIASGNGIGNGTDGRPATHTGVVPWAKAGIIVKETTNQGSVYAAVMVTPSHGVRMQWNYVHDVAGYPGQRQCVITPVAAPYSRRGRDRRLRLARRYPLDKDWNRLPDRPGGQCPGRNVRYLT